MPATLLRLHVRFFAVLRGQARCSTLLVGTSTRTPAALYAELQEKHTLTFPVALLRVSVNERYADMATPLNAGDRVVFIPPVAGG